MSTIFSLYFANLKEFMRDRGAIIWTLAFPLIFIVLFGVIFGGNSAPNYTVGIVNEDNGPSASSWWTHSRRYLLSSLRRAAATPS